MKLTVCDDSRSDAQVLKQLCETYFAKHQYEADVTVVTDPWMVRAEQADILILDVEMPELDGITLKDQLAMESDCPLIIFATRYADAMSKAFNRNVIGFLLKPVDSRQLEDMLELAILHLNLDKEIELPHGRRISTGDIVRIHADRGYTVLHLVSGQPEDGGRKSLDQWEVELTEQGFLRIEKSCIVSSRHIKSFRDDKIILKETDKDGAQICLRVSRRRKKECYQQYLCYLSKIAKYI